MSAKLYFLYLFLCLILMLSEASLIAKLGCPENCGDISIPYPFGIGSNCSMGRWAEVKCDTRFNPPKLFFSHSIPDEIVEIIIDGNYNYVRVKYNVSKICFNGSGAPTSSHYPILSLYKNTPFSFSVRNSLMVIGCNIYGKINGVSWSEDSEEFTVGCTSHCDQTENSGELQCPGPGCCEVRVDQGTGQNKITVEALNVSGTTETRCGSAFLTDDVYNFNASDFVSAQDSTLSLDFRVGNQTCEDAQKDPSSFACKGVNNYCWGYSCRCDPGYEGNPYLDIGCQSKGECNDTQKSMCKYKCIKYPNGYVECAKPFFLRELKWIISGVGVGLFFLFVAGVWIYYKKKKQLSKLGEQLDQLNARLLLIQEISSNAKIFTAKKLQQATDNFNESRVLGEGGYGTVYKGILPDQSIVAVKKSKIIEKSQFDEFINEVAILAKIDHKNIVKLLGCSVETEHPLLVYEFVSNGTLTDHLFKKNGTLYSSMTWENRLRIAAEIAGALAYLHSAASIPIIHRDIKSSNILLDEKFTAKVADFGVSRLNHLEQTAIGTLVKGTLGYLDPEYMLTSQLTEKSDVYSFGVVLAELVTGKKSISFERAQGERNLAIYFTASMNEQRLLHIVEEGMVNEGNIKQVQGVAALAKRCLSFKGEERPPMKVVASELESLRGFIQKRSSTQRSDDNHTNFTLDQSNLYPTSAFYHGAFGSVVPEITMSVMVAR